VTWMNINQLEGVCSPSTTFLSHGVPRSKLVFHFHPLNQNRVLVDASKKIIWIKNLYRKFKKFKSGLSDIHCDN